MRRKPLMIDSVTEGPWGSAVNWVMHADRLLANMTQYRANARNCEAKRLHIVASTEPNVACECAHVGAARHEERRCGLRRRAAACAHKLGSLCRTMANWS